MSDSIAREAQSRIEAGEPGDSLCHLVTFPGYPDGAYLSTALPAGSDLSGHTAQYRTLDQWAGFENEAIYKEWLLANTPRAIEFTRAPALGPWRRLVDACILNR